MMSQQMQLGDWAPTLDESLSQFHTPVKLCQRMVKLAGVAPGMRVVEPSAGGGNIVRELISAGAFVTAIEIDPRWRAVLSSEFGDRAFTLCGDFTKMESQPFDLAVMNPPLTNGVAAHHIRLALNWAPRVVSIIRSQDMHGVDRWDELWSDCDLATEVKLVRRPIYSGAGGKIENTIVEVYRKGEYHGPQKVEWWTDDWR